MTKRDGSRVLRDLRRFLEEDAPRGDVTTKAVLGRTAAQAALRANEACVVAGLEEAAALFRLRRCRVKRTVRDGSRVSPGTKVLEATGDAAALLLCERLALNIVMRMSGIATATRKAVAKVRAANPHVEVAATRKTTPGFRWFEKRAVELGGGKSHRFDLSAAILVKENHADIAGGIGVAVRRAKRRHPGSNVEAEARDLDEAMEAAGAGAEWILLDNMGPAMGASVARRLKKAFPKVRIEVSGGITLQNVATRARYADRVSLGALTHSVRACDFSMDVRPVEGSARDRGGRTHRGERRKRAAKPG
ncbi:MAG: carboxylating nicotinate-nucleotide diphosphorylase [Euryarchaeota archaeon]|nr:carboxylating nicotinate-nucleotide diphosphorylase [Euryarchaeota archaeon]